MGQSQSGQVVEGSDDEEEGDDDKVIINDERGRTGSDYHLLKKVLEQEPEVLPFHASASPLSPQLSSSRTSRLVPTIKVCDPYNVLAPSSAFSRNFSENAMYDYQTVTEVFLISHGECELNLRPDLIWGRCTEAALIPNVKRQARAMAVFLKSQGTRFSAVYSSPLDRARLTAVSICKEINFTEEQIQPSDALADMSHGNWEGCLCSEIYTPEVLGIIDRFQPDFTAPSVNHLDKWNSE